MADGAKVRLADRELVVFKRDLVRVPQRFIDYRIGRNLSVPKIVAEQRKNNHGFGSYYFYVDDPVLSEVVLDAESWVDPGGPFRQGNIVKAARYFLKAVSKR